MSNLSLLIPVNLDVLMLGDEIQVAGPLLDFTKLPWEHSYDYKDAPYLSETIASKTIGSRHQLQSGLHFHWSLPLALTKTSTVGLIYRQSFHSVFGKGKGTDRQKSGEEIWKILKNEDWFHAIDDQIGIARTTLPDNQDLFDQLQSKFPNQVFAIRKILKTAVFPTIPNRWLLSRIIDGETVSTQLIESDYVWQGSEEETPDDKELKSSHTIYPKITEDPAEKPYLFLGRAYELEEGPQTPPTYLDTPLTAVGYGEPAFASFYPICRSVLGHHDPNPPHADHEQYELIGWFENPEQDYLHIFIKAFKESWNQAHPSKGKSGINQQHQQINYLYLDLLDAIYRELRLEIRIQIPVNKLQNIHPDANIEGMPKNAYQYLQKHLWIDEDNRLLPKAYSMTTFVSEPFQSKTDCIRKVLNEAIEAQLPDRLICYARCSLPENVAQMPDVNPEKIKITLGNTPTEALSALLASEISTEKKNVIEDQLEAIQFSATLQQTSVDTGPLFEALRHQKQFHAVPGGQRWRITSRNDTVKKAKEVSADDQIALPESVANLLNQLNQLEEQKTLHNSRIGSLRRQIYADWCWYLKWESELKKEVNDSQGFDDTDQGFDTTEQFGNTTEQFGDTAEAFGDFDDSFGDSASQSDDSEGEESDEDSGNPYTAAKAEFLASFKTFIQDEIEHQLSDLRVQEDEIKEKIREQFAKLQAALLEFRYEWQFLFVDDVTNWDTFTKTINDNATAFSFLQDLPPTDNKTNYLMAINEKLAALDKPIPWPTGVSSSDSYNNLITELSQNGLPSFLRASRLMRANRLALEAYFPGCIKHRPALELVPQAASRFWRPNDPVVLISGFAPTPRHQDSKQSTPTALLPIDWELSSQEPDSLHHLKQLLDETFGGSVIHGHSPEWHPIFLAWETAVSQAHQVQSETYGPAYLKDHFRLGAVELELLENPTFDSPNPFYGRSILTPSASNSLAKTITNRLVPFLYQQFIETYVQSAEESQTKVSLFNEWIKTVDSNTEGLLIDPDLPDEQQIKQWLTEQLDHRTTTDRSLVRNLLEASANTHSPIFQQFIEETGENNFLGNIDPFLTWCEDRIHIKAAFAANNSDALNDEPLDIALVDDVSILNQFVEHLHQLLGDQTLKRFFDEKQVPDEQQGDFLHGNVNAVMSWYQPQVSTALHLIVEIRAYLALLDMRGLSQAMSGFGNALIMRHQAYQLPINNPFPHDDDNDFTTQVRNAVQTANKVAPLEGLPFSPWRAGKIHLSELELIDNFGRYWPTTPGEEGASLADFPVQATDTMPNIGESTAKEFIIPPRLAQGARLNFRWLAARTELEELNDRPASNPICGWLVPNHLDDSLMIYAADGTALGYIDEGAHWRTFPGNRSPILPADIANPHLAQMVQWVCAQGTDFLADFLSTLGIAQEHIEPESFSQHEALALLMGQPLALVRADVQLQLREPPAINVSEIKVQNDVTAFIDQGAEGKQLPRHTFGFEQVQVPLRLGEFHRLNDGLVGYWLENKNGQYKNNNFYAPQTVSTPGLSGTIVTRHAENAEDANQKELLIDLTMQETAPQKLTLLLDPRAPIHATTGILPVKALYIPKDQYAPALQRIEIAFLTAPILTPGLGIELSLPSEPGFDWQWIQQEGQQWAKISAEGIIHRHQLEKLFGAGVDVLWGALITQGWLEAVSNNEARIVPTDKRTDSKLPPPFDQLEEAIDLLFHRLRIYPFDTTARFDTKYEIREGWLRLSRSNPQ